MRHIKTLRTALKNVEVMRPMFESVYCTECNQYFGPGGKHFHACSDHSAILARPAELQRWRITINDCSEVKMGRDKTGAYIKYIEHRYQVVKLVLERDCYHAALLKIRKYSPCGLADDIAKDALQGK